MQNFEVFVPVSAGSPYLTTLYQRLQADGQQQEIPACVCTNPGAERARTARVNGINLPCFPDNGSESGYYTNSSVAPIECGPSDPFLVNTISTPTSNVQQLVATPIPIQHVQQRNQESGSPTDVVLIALGLLIGGGWFFALRSKKPKIIIEKPSNSQQSNTASLVEEYQQTPNAVLESDYVQLGDSYYRIDTLTSASVGRKIKKTKVSRQEATNNPPGTKKVHVNTDRVRGASRETPDGTTSWWAILWQRRR